MSIHPRQVSMRERHSGLELVIRCKRFIQVECVGQSACRGDRETALSVCVNHLLGDGTRAPALLLLGPDDKNTSMALRNRSGILRPWRITRMQPQSTYASCRRVNARMEMGLTSIVRSCSTVCSPSLRYIPTTGR